MKKFLCMILAVLTAACAMGMAACGGNGSNGKVKMINISLSSEEYAVAVSKTNKSLLATVNEVLSENADEIAELIEEYEAKDYENDTPTDETYVEGVVKYEEGMSADSYLIMATDAPFAPWEYMVGENYGGIDVEIGNMIAQKLGKTLAVKQTAFDSICLTVNQGGADIGLAGLTVTPARAKTVNFSDAYYTGAYQVIVVNENDTTFDGCKTAEEVEAILKGMENGTKVGSQTGTTGAKYISGDVDDPDGFGFEGFKNLTLQNYETHADAVRDMVNGTVAFCVVDNLVAAQIVAQINAAA